MNTPFIPQHPRTNPLFKPLSMLIAAIMACSSTMASANILYEEYFEQGPGISAPPPEWQTIHPNQWVENGWLHSADQNGWPRDSEALVHDNDTAWTNYKLEASVQMLGPWTNATLLLRSQGYSRSSGGSAGQAYELAFLDQGAMVGPINRVTLTRVDCRFTCTATELASSPFALDRNASFNVTALLIGGHIQVTANGLPVIDVNDANPITYGGIGIHSIWETHNRFDNFKVTAVPEPESFVLLGSGLLMLLGIRARKNRCT